MGRGGNGVGVTMEVRLHGLMVRGDGGGEVGGVVKNRSRVWWTDHKLFTLYGAGSF